jgi:hypothetical protein
MARLRNEFPMYCLTSDQRNVPMWAYYAGAHTGVCIHLDATIAPFGAAFKVFYEDEYPFLPQPVAGMKPRAVIKAMLAYKGEGVGTRERIPLKSTCPTMTVAQADGVWTALFVQSGGAPATSGPNPLFRFP